jgi:hypothetical protein
MHQKSRDLQICEQFPNLPANQDDYKRDMNANIVLNRNFAASDATSARDALTAPAENSVFPSRWPRCFATLRTNQDPALREWIRPNSSTDHNFALLFEYIPDLELLTREAVTTELCHAYMQVLADLHALKILHRDQILHAAWPEIVFNNLFLRQNRQTGVKGSQFHDFFRHRN